MAMDIGEAEVAALAAEGEPFVVDAELVKNGGVEIVDVNLVLNGVIAELVGGTVGEARLHSTAGHPHCEAVRVMITTPGFPHHLSDRGAAKFAAPDDKGIVKQSALFEICDERGNRLVGGSALTSVFAIHVGV